MESAAPRLLALLSLLQTRPQWTAGELAERLRVTPRTVRRDMTRLRDLGYPVDAEPGPHGGYRLGSGAALPPLLLSDDEAVAVVVGLRLATGHGVTGFEESAVAALAKLEQVMPSRLRHRVGAVQAATVPARRPGRPPGRRRHHRVGRPGVPGARAPPVRLRRQRRPGDRAAGRALPAGARRAAVVPGGVRPVAARLADVPARPHARARRSTARASCGTRSPTRSPWWSTGWPSTPTTTGPWSPCPCRSTRRSRSSRDRWGCWSRPTTGVACASAATSTGWPGSW